MSITKKEDTLLHVVSSTKHTHFAQKVVNKMTVEDLELKNRDGETALCVAVASSIKMVDILLQKNYGLLQIRKKGGLPILCAIWCGDKNMVAHIYSKINLAETKWTQSDHKKILNSCLALGLYGKLQIFSCLVTHFLFFVNIYKFKFVVLFLLSIVACTNPISSNKNFFHVSIDTDRLLSCLLLEFFIHIISDLESNFADIALNLLIHYKKEGILKVDTRVLRYLAYDPSAFDETVQPFIRRLIDRG